MSTFPDLIRSYLAGIETMKQAVAGMSREQLLAKPVPGTWSTLEVVAHIADFEPVLAERMKRIISHDRPLLFVADENLFAATLGYHDRDVAEELDLIETTRKQMGRILKGLPVEAASRVGIHTYKGLVTLEAVLTSAVNHIPHHVKFIEAKRAALKR
ncbi:MAG: DinB family protein [Planctomycetes bacterium]|nr:DinB family protein [Planctomycetota bacterium]